MVKPLRLFALQFLNYGLICASFRFLAAGSYLGVGVLDGVIAGLGFALTRYVVAAETKTERAAYIAGGVAGSLLGLWLTRNWKAA